MGTALPDQDVRFSTTAGQLFTGGLGIPIPASNIPIFTNSVGNSAVDLITRNDATITIIAGNASTTVEVVTVQSPLHQIILTIDNTPNSLCTGTSSVDVHSCSQEICFAAEAIDLQGSPLDGVVIVFSLQNNTWQGSTFNGTFTPSQAVTGASGNPGIARTKFSINPDCPVQCSLSQGAADCMAEVVAATQGGIRSLPIQLNIEIP